MEMIISRQFTVLSLHPERGRITVSAASFRFALAAAAIADFYMNGELSEEDKRLTPSPRHNGDPFHDRLIDLIANSAHPKKILYWIRKLSRKSRQNLEESISVFVSGAGIRHEKKYFLGIFSYSRYYFTDPGVRSSIVENLREIVINGKNPSDEQLLILALMKATNSLSHLASEYSERSVIRGRARELFKKDEFASKYQKFARLIISSVTVATAAEESSYVA